MINNGCCCLLVPTALAGVPTPKEMEENCVVLSKLGASHLATPCNQSQLKYGVIYGGLLKRQYERTDSMNA